MRPLAFLSSAFLTTILPTVAAQATPAATDDFFEEKIRPILANHCYKCHGAKKQRSGLRVDHISFLKQGGERGPALVPGKPDASLLIAAVAYQDEDLQMPPKRRLSGDDVELLTQWIKMGAPWPDEPPPKAKGKKEVFDLPKRRAKHWSWRPLAQPTLPKVSNEEWHAPIDRFVHARFSGLGLKPAPVANRSTLLRRVTFDLTGLPPTLSELDAFLADDSSGAFERVVDRLLASPHFGEHWARHWLDLVRYADSLGHEFDYKIPNAYRYRDYVIRAFNDDLPYDQFVKEQIAGDLLPFPRRDRDGYNQSALGTGFYWLVEQTHSPVDVRKHMSDRTDNQIDVMTKTFLGLTVGCARCHDHKFDAISTADYYALSGFLKSSRYMQIDTAPPPAADLVADYLKADSEFASRQFARIDRGIRAGGATMLAGIRAPKPAPEKGRRRKRRKKNDKPLPADPAGRWQHALANAQVERDAFHPMHAVGLHRKHPGKDVRQHWLRAAAGGKRRQAEFEKSGAVRFADFRTQDFAEWFQEGRAFGDGPMRKPFVVRRGGDRAAVHPAGWAYSGRRGLTDQGVLHSKSFKIEKRYIHFLAFGRESRVRVVLEGFNIIRNPIYGGLHQFVGNETPQWRTIDLKMWQGKEAFLSLNDQSTPGMADPSRGNGYAKDGYLAVQQIWFSDSRTLPEPRANYPEFVLGTDGPPLTRDVDVVDAYSRAARTAVETFADDVEGGKRRFQPEHAHLLNWLLDQRLLGDESSDLVAARRALEAIEPKIATTRHVPGMVDGTGADESIYIRGSHNTLGAVVPRRNLEGLGGKRDKPLQSRDGSGRLRLAERMLAADNPYISRVLVNRLWHHLFGKGIVATVDNFGVLGKEPTHPQLLDWMANEFRADGWSIKRAIRRIVLSRTYRAASSPGPNASKVDPTNDYLSHASVRRLPGESIRDGILATSGRLDPKMFGAGVPVYLDQFMTGRGRPRGGPIDGHGRRSIYLSVPRNFLTKFLLAFDMPRPALSMGRRTVTNVPAQALALLNDPFVQGEANRLAKRVLAAGPNTTTRIKHLYRLLFSRPADSDEQARIREFLTGQSQAYSCPPDDPRPWQDLCHALFNVKEFFFLR